MLRSASALSLALAFILPACGGESPPAASPPPVTSAVPAASAAPAPAPTASAAPAPAEPAKPAGPASVAKYTGLAHPESVLYDAENDRYLVSNINGNPGEKDNNGFISVLSPDGSVTTLKWIEAGKKVKLNAPKGLAIADGVLYAADLDVVRKFDLKTGEPKGSVAIPGATFLNDLASGPDGKIYVTDSGIKFTEKGEVVPTKTDAVYAIDKGKIKTLAKGPDLGGPNGIIVTDKGGIIVNSFGSGEIYRIDEKGKKQDVTKPPGGALDGLLALGDKLIVTSWQASAVYEGTLGGTFEVVIPDQKSPADIGYDTKRSRVLVPRMMEDTVEAFELK